MLPTAAEHFKDESDFIAAFNAGARHAFRFTHDMLSKFFLFFIIEAVNDEEPAENILSDSFYQLFLERSEMKTFSDINEWLYNDVTVRCNNYLVEHPGPNRADSPSQQVLQARIKTRILQFEFWKRYHGRFSISP